MFLLRWGLFFLGLVVFSSGISLTIQMQHLGIHPWDVLNVALYETIGLSIGTWTIIIGIALVGVSYILDKRYIKLGTFLNALIIGLCVDFFLWSGILPVATETWTDVIFLVLGIVIMGIGGGLYNAGGVGSGPRDGFMLSIADKTGISIRRVRIMSESFVLILGLILGGPVFIFTFIFTFIQSPIFEATYLRMSGYVERQEEKSSFKQVAEK